MGKLEKDVMKSVHQRLTVWRMSGEVINFHRLNSGKVRNMHTGSWINLGEKDTPDWIVMLRNTNKNITVIYIECKSDTGKLTPGQLVFYAKYNKLDDVYVIKITDIKDLDNFINIHSVNRINELDSITL